MKQVILTGLRANNDLHIGNYLGALLPLIDMAKKHAGEYQVNLFIPDLHSFTTPIDHSKLYDQIVQNVRVYLAAGLPVDDPNVFVYRQSHVSAHSELTWILDCFTGMGEMNRMTQFKDKSAKLSEDRVSIGLFHYPVLMAADILLYDAAYVPVGDDQTQHLEFTRDIAERMNNQFGQLFTIPAPVAKQHEFFGKDQGLRIKDLADPTKKMSKSDETGKGVIFLSDSPEVATRKIMSATTDSFSEIKYDMQGRPGVSNLLQMLTLLTGRELKEVITEYEGKTTYGDLKKAVAEKVSAFLVDFQNKLKNIDEAAALAKLEKDEAAMREQANKVLQKAQRAIGLRPTVTGDKHEDVVAYSQELKKLGIENSVINHKSLRDASKVVAELGLTLEDSLPTLLMYGDGKFVAAVLRHVTKLDMEKVKAIVGLKDLRMATKEEFTRYTGLPVGAARVYLPHTITIVDPKVFDKDYLVGGSGRFDCSVRYKTADLKKLPGVTVADISNPLEG